MKNISLRSLASRQQIACSSPECITFPVVRKELMYLDHTGTYASSGQNVIIRSDTNDIIATCTNKYHLIPNEDIINALADISVGGLHLHRYRNILDRRFRIELRGDFPAPIEINGYPVVSRVSISNSYDGTERLSINIGCYIQVCGNGMLANHNWLPQVKLKVRHLTSAENILDGVAEIYENNIGIVGRKFAELNFSNDPCDDKLERIAKKFPVKQGVHPVVQQIITKTKATMNQYQIGNENFALMMALTNLSTYPDENSVPASYVEIIEDCVTDLFTN